ncbi:unnamed protein product [Calypogeia fissa]
MWYWKDSRSLEREGGPTAREIRLEGELQYTKLYCPRKSFPWGLGRRRRAMSAYIGGAVTFGECGFPGARKNNIVQERTSKAVSAVGRNDTPTIAVIVVLAVENWR